jgi:metal-responsive CopG/Arc/MetJ family transcriptional regulator
MKTAISLADSLFQRAERFAQARRLSRSELYAAALEAYLAQHEGADITAQLDALYAEEESSLAPELRELGFEALRRAEH